MLYVVESNGNVSEIKTQNKTEQIQVGHMKSIGNRVDQGHRGIS